ncbi:hypothetical protein U0070_017978, partial [Myodes glareolus]
DALLSEDVIVKEQLEVLNKTLEEIQKEESVSSIRSFEEQEIKSIENLKEEEEILGGEIALLTKQQEKEEGGATNRDLPARPTLQKTFFATPNHCATALAPVSLEAATREMNSGENGGPTYATVKSDGAVTTECCTQLLSGATVLSRDQDEALQCDSWGCLSYNLRKKDIQRFFSGYGCLLEMDLKNGYGFMEFEDSHDTDDAYELNSKKLCGKQSTARGPCRDRDGYSYGIRSGGGGYSSQRTSGRDKYGPPVHTEYRLIVENLSSRCSWQDLKDFMQQAGEVTYADSRKECTNEGVIEFTSYSDMKCALDKLDGTEINGINTRLFEDKPQTSHRSRSKDESGKSQNRSCAQSPKENGKGDTKSKSKSQSQSQSHSPLLDPPSKTYSASPPPKRASRSHSRYRS